MRRAWLAVVVLLLSTSALPAQHRPGATTDRYDHLFKKYSKRFFGPAYDWRLFKAQAMTESNLSPEATSRVGARGLMQLMPSTFREVQTKNPEFESIDDPEWNIAAGISYDRWLWRIWDEHPTLQDRKDFMFGSYNAGSGTLRRAQETARSRQLDERCWQSIAEVAPNVKGWRYRETLEYVRRIHGNAVRLVGKGVAATSDDSSPADE